jgi:hypothetical protein
MLLQSKGQVIMSQAHTRLALQAQAEQHEGHTSKATGVVGAAAGAVAGAVMGGVMGGVTGATGTLAVTGGAAGALGALGTAGWTIGVLTGAGRVSPPVGAFAVVLSVSAVRNQNQTRQDKYERYRWAHARPHDRPNLLIIIIIMRQRRFIIFINSRLSCWSLCNAELRSIAMEL